MVAWYESGGAGKPYTKRWWSSPEEMVHDDVFGVAEELAKTQDYTKQQDLHHAKMYGGMNLRGLDPYGYNSPHRSSERIGFNVIESSVDTILSDIIAQKPRPQFLTEDGDWNDQKKAKLLTQFVSGQFYQNKIHDEVMPRVCQDALVFGTGVAKVYWDPREQCPKAERVPVHEVLVDDAECCAGPPRSIYHVKRVPRDALLARFPEHSVIINNAETDSGPHSRKETQDMVLCVEAWRIPAIKDGEGGRHVLCLKSGPLIDEEWRKDYLPFVVLRYKRRLHGFRGKGIAEILNSKQIALNFLMFKVHEKLKGWANTIFVRPGSQLNPAHLTNEEWNIVETTEPPMVVTPQSVPSDLFNEVERLKNDAYSEVGVSMLAARAEIPAGLDGGSGKALRIYSDTKSRRFIDFVQQWEKAHLSLAEHFIQLTKDAVEAGDANGATTVLAPDSFNRRAKRIKWADVNLDRDRYIMKAFPTSFITGTPQGKLADIQELITVFPQFQQYAPSLLDFPDLESFSSIVNSSTDASRQVIEHILDTGEYVPPEPFQNLGETLQLAQSYYLKAKLGDAPDEVLEPLRQYMKAITVLMEPEPQPELPPQNAPAPGGQALPPEIMEAIK